MEEGGFNFQFFLSHPKYGWRSYLRLGTMPVYGRHWSIVSLTHKESLCLTQSFDYLNIKTLPSLASDLVTCLEGKRRQIGFSMLCHLASWVNMSRSNWHFKASELMCLESCPVFRGHSFLIFHVSLPCLGLSAAQAFPVSGKFVSGICFFE